MIYLDYSATTPVNQKVLDLFNKASLEYIGNPNSSHKLGVLAKERIDKTSEYIASLLKIKPNEIIYTSGASEANNLAIKGIAAKNKQNKHIITTLLEHSSVIGPIGYLQKNGYTIDFVNLTSDGHIDVNHLKTLLRSDTILVAISSVNSELGIKEPINEIGDILSNYPNCAYLVDITQSIGKHEISLHNIDLAVFSAQKFYGLKGIGGLIKKENIELEPLIHGGKSTTIYRSGTPALPLIVSLEAAFELAFENLECKEVYIQKMNDKLREFFKEFDKVHINSPIGAIPHILNISIKGYKADLLLKKFDSKDICLSSQTACSLDSIPSRSIMAITKDLDLATSSLRISLSYLTKEIDISSFMLKFKEIYEELEHENSKI
jgi:cysteine desulfurase